MAAAALALYLTWVALAFGWQTIRQHHRTGDTGLRLAARPGTAQWWAKLGFITAMALGLAAPIAALAGLDDIAPFDRVRVLGYRWPPNVMAPPAPHRLPLLASNGQPSSRDEA